MNLWMMALVAATVGLCTSMIFLIIRGSIHKTRWGINFGWSGECPACHNHRSFFRIPQNSRQCLWGGGTCNRCGLEVDKWNRPLSPL
jgi:hypothetical protein